MTVLPHLRHCCKQKVTFLATVSNGEGNNTEEFGGQTMGLEGIYVRLM